jgi:hypothetical protein
VINWAPEAKLSSRRRAGTYGRATDGLNRSADCQLGNLCGPGLQAAPNLRVGLSIRLRDRPFVTGVNGTATVVRTALIGALLTCAAAAWVVYLYVFGESVPHLHVHLAPHHDGDALNTNMIRGPLEERAQPSSATALVSSEFPCSPSRNSAPRPTE